MPAAKEIRLELARLRRRAFLAGWLGSMARASVACAAVLTVAVLGLHTFDHALAPRPWWALGLLAPAAYAWWSAARRTPDARALAAHLDRSLGGAGLLLSALERDAGPWAADVQRHLADARTRTPRVRAAGGTVARIALAVVGVALLALLPVPQVSAGGGASRAVERAIDDARRDLELAAEAGLLGDQQARELLERADELERRLLDGDPVAWDDVDALAERLERSGENAAAGLNAVRSGAEALAGELDRRGAEPRDLEELARLAARAAELGMLEDLPPEVRKALEQLAQRGGTDQGAGDPARAGAGLDPASLDPERLKQLAEALKEQGGTRMQRARDAARGAGPGPDELRRMLEEQGVMGQRPGGGGGDSGIAEGPDGFDPTPGPDGDGAPGRGGINRGRGDAALQHFGDSEVDASGMRAERLPDGVVPPDRWDVAGVGRAEPETAPDRTGVASGAAAAGGPGDVSFRRDLAPRHREAVRRFFGGGADGGRGR